MLNIVLPMAGHGSRFANAGYSVPKPLIPVGKQTMTELVVHNLRPGQPHRFIFVCQQAHLDRYGLAAHLEAIAPGCAIVPVDQVTQGAACTVLLARAFIDNDAPLMIANCDQYVDIAIDDYLARMESEQLDGLIMTMTADDPKWSFVRLDAQRRITEVVEKVVVSDEATVGIYNFRRGADFVAAADSMIAQDKRVNGEFYVAPAYNEMLAQGSRLGFYNIGSDRAGMYGLGIPEDLDYFLRERWREG
ncbi:glycosyltransferase family 2 protein [Pseudoduganella aquatica]|uniref:NTP transferase domain-containing protein n=1 Tax=Pseudoduganella aquatica TaxID=2660641 RepID=A0A7X4HGD4_9BURK|nr:glycosyltransferase family 2 protein [Pseudoduganella aquatica]MYN10027.1 NTP transferase domain-containing protein [Pseudoduganella aquatica]